MIIFDIKCNFEYIQINKDSDKKRTLNGVLICIDIPWKNADALPTKIEPFLLFITWIFASSSSFMVVKHIYYKLGTMTIVKYGRLNLLYNWLEFYMYKPIKILYYY